MSAGPDDRAPSDIDLRVAEYVLGALSASERSSMELELAVDPSAQAAVGAWERWLAPLSDIIPEVEPGPRVWPMIASALPRRAPAANDNRVRDLARKVFRWRLATAAAGALAAGLALFIAVGRGADEARYVAVVSRGGEAPALLVSIDTAAGSVRVRPVAAEAPAGRSLELWYVGAGKSPKTLGLVGTEASRIALPAESRGAGLPDGVFAVSVEPPGGSPTGAPTGPVVYSGKLIRD